MKKFGVMIELFVKSEEAYIMYEIITKADNKKAACDQVNFLLDGKDYEVASVKEKK